MRTHCDKESDTQRTPDILPPHNKRQFKYRAQKFLVILMKYSNFLDVVNYVFNYFISKPEDALK